MHISELIKLCCEIILAMANEAGSPDDIREVKILQKAMQASMYQGAGEFWRN